MAARLQVSSCGQAMAADSPRPPTTRPSRSGDPTTGQCLSTLRSHASSVWSIAWSSDDRQLASGSCNNAIKIWDLETVQCVSTLKGHTKPIWSVEWSSDDSRLASASDDRTIKIWDPTTSQCISTPSRAIVTQSSLSHGQRTAVGLPRHLTAGPLIYGILQQAAV